MCRQNNAGREARKGNEAKEEERSREGALLQARWVVMGR